MNVGTVETLENLSIERISGLLNTAMDDEEWHTPSVIDINIKSQTIWAVYGWCNISKHNTYHDKEVWFNINGNNIKIWEVEYVKGKANKHLNRTIYNFLKLGEELKKLTINNPKK